MKPNWLVEAGKLARLGVDQVRERRLAAFSVLGVIAIVTLALIVRAWLGSGAAAMPAGTGVVLTEYLRSLSDQEWTDIERDAADGAPDAQYLLAVRPFSAETPTLASVEAALEPIAATGHRLARLALAETRLLNGKPEDDAEALANLKALAHLGVVAAARDLAFGYETGFGVPRDPVFALGYAEMAAAQSGYARTDLRTYARIAAKLKYLPDPSSEIWEHIEDTKASKRSADMQFLVLMSDSVTEDLSARAVLERLVTVASDGSTPARLGVADEFASGDETVVEPEVIKGWLKGLASSGDAHAALSAYQLGLFHEDEAAEMLLAAVAQGDDILRSYQPEDQRLVGELLLELGTDEAMGEAIHRLTAAALGGDSRARRLLAEVYVESAPDDARSAELAFALLKTLADDGDAWAMTELGLAFADGWAPGGPNMFEAMRWFEPAAMAGAQRAVSEIELAYREGLGVVRDVDLADAVLPLVVVEEAEPAAAADEPAASPAAG